MQASIYGVKECRPSIWVYLEQEGGALEQVSAEILTKGKELAAIMGWELTGLLLGHRISHLAGEAFRIGAEKIWINDHPLLENFTIEPYTKVVFQNLLDGKPAVFLLGATPNGRDLAGRLAVRLRTGLNADCTNLDINPDTGVMVCKVSGFGGGVMAMIEMANHRPQMATIRPGVFQVAYPVQYKSGEIIQVPVNLTEADIKTHIIKRVMGDEVNLSQAEMIIAGGRGMEGDFQTLSLLASLFGGEVGATRPPVDEGQIARERQIGQTGVICSPKVALCCGISGMFHFVVGIEKADVVIAINSDAEAPIFEHADYCVVADANELLPEIIGVLQREMEQMHA